ncbi:hypothetical protein PIB30_023032 [Stylosanthes scabra]|uniref:Uncharacterized protein n=1 Tax=Stylosanthes scabra TaxID=79078 RepID=A0ABU6V987_9FABA|nr:hypothetical protein [Stylosanthes scabra]
MEKLEDEILIMEHHQSFEAKDPLTESIYSLQIAQEALEQELKSFGEIWNQPVSSASTSLEHKALSKLEELRGMLALKDSKIAELERALSDGEEFKDAELEIESLKAEVEYLASLDLKAESVSLKKVVKQGAQPRIQVQVPKKIEHFGDIIAVEEAFRIQKSVYKLTFFFSLQLILLILVFLLFDSQLLLDSGIVVPT